MRIVAHVEHSIKNKMVFYCHNVSMCKFSKIVIIKYQKCLYVYKYLYLCIYTILYCGKCFRFSTDCVY